MARLIVLDASVAIAALAADDAHHAAASAALATTTDDELVVAATTRAEILVGPARVGGAAFATARNFVDGCATVPVSASIADDAAALKARHRALSLPDAIALVVADLIDADAVWTFDRRWSGLGSRVTFRERGAGVIVVPPRWTIPARTKDFKDQQLGKVDSYGVYDIGSDEGWVSVGVDADTAEFAVASTPAGGSTWARPATRRPPR